MADKGIAVAEATTGTLDKIDMKQATNANSETVYQQRVVIAADETSGPGGTSDADALYTRQARGALSTGQVSVTTAATLIKAAATGRIDISIYNSGSVPVVIGGTSGVTATTGHIVPAGGSISFSSYAGDLYGIVATGSATVSYAATA